jgi:glycosyltransferase involved in cell wall biosynthesis
MQQAELVSVIIPVYNTELYLRKCLDSVIQQTYRNLEIIVIDDGSTDSSGKICDEYAERDKRIIVKHQPDLGVGVTRNIALKMCRGRFITFVDSDDYISCDMIEFLYQTLISNGADMACCGNCDIGLNGELIPYLLPKYKTIYNDNQEFLYDVLIYKVRVEVWGKLFRTALFEKVKFDEDIKRAEDFIFWIDAFSYFQKIVSIDEKKYYRVMRPGSVMSFTKFDSDLMIWIIFSIDRAMVTLNTLGERFAELGRKMCLETRVRYIKDVFKYRQDMKYLVEVEKIREYFKGYWRQILVTAYLSTKEKIMCFLLILSPPLFKFCYNGYLKIKGEM